MIMKPWNICTTIWTSCLNLVTFSRTWMTTVFNVCHGLKELGLFLVTRINEFIILFIECLDRLIRLTPWWRLLNFDLVILLCKTDLLNCYVQVNPHTHQLKLCDFGSAKVLVNFHPALVINGVTKSSCFIAWCWSAFRFIR